MLQSGAIANSNIFPKSLVPLPRLCDMGVDAAVALSHSVRGPCRPLADEARARMNAIELYIIKKVAPALNRTPHSFGHTRQAQRGGAR